MTLPDLNNVMRLLLRTVAVTVGLSVATALIPEITVSGTTRSANASTLFTVAVIFGVVNAALQPIIFGVVNPVLRPIMTVLGGLFYLVSSWLVAFVVNALLFLLVSWLAGLLHLPFHVQGFWSAFWGAITVSLVSWAIAVLARDFR
jgi:putative membrane protein